MMYQFAIHDQRKPLRCYIQLYFPLWFCLVIALIVRAWLFIHTRGVIDADEALVGIQAQHIVHGVYPIYFYSQPYMGSLEAYFIALLCLLVGPSVWILHITTTLISLASIWLTWRLARALAEAAQLPTSIQWRFMTIATLFSAIPPLYDAVMQLRALGGYIETFVLMLLLLLCTLRLTCRWSAGASWREIAWRWSGIGLIVGLGFWINPLIISAVLASAIWIAWHYNVKGLLLAVTAFPTGIVGLSPALFWGARHNWENVRYLFTSGGTASISPKILELYPTRLALLVGLTQQYATCIAPRVIGGALPKEQNVLLALHAFSLVSGVLCILSTTLLVTASFIYHHPLLIQVRRITALPLLFGLCTAGIFCGTTTAAGGLLSCNYDVAGRYATPLMIVLPFFFAHIITLISMTELHRYKKQRLQLQPMKVPFLLPSTHAPHRFLQGIQVVLLVFLCLSLTAQVGTYGLTNAGRTFQSPYCTTAPASNDAIIAYMQREHIHYAWASNWLAYPIVFKTNSNIVVADPRPVMPSRYYPPYNRIPANTSAVSRVEHASMLVFAHTNDTHPLLLRLLDKEQVDYRAMRFPSGPGIDVVVVTPLNRTVSPLKEDIFFSIFGCIEP